MRLLLDTANIDDIGRLLQSRLFLGVTTNPSLMAKEPKTKLEFDHPMDGFGDYVASLKKVRDALLEAASKHSRRSHLSVEVPTNDSRFMYEQAKVIYDALRFNDAKQDLTTSSLDIYIKIPVTLDNLLVITRLSDSLIPVNATACMTAIQAKMAEDAGASIVSFFYNRILDGQGYPQIELANFRHMQKGRARVICGSIRKAEDIVMCAPNADYVTIGPKVAQDAISHPQTDKAITQFTEDIKKWLG